MDPKKIAEIIANLSEAEPQQLAEAKAALFAQAQAFATEDATKDNLAKLRAIKADYDKVTEALALRSEYTATLGEFDTHDPSKDLVPPEPGEGVPNPGGEPTQETAPAEGAGEPPAATTEDAGGAGAGTEPKENAATGRALGQLNEQNGRPKVTVLTVVKARTLAAGNIPGISAGQQFTDETLARAFADKAHALGGPSSVGRHDVARIEFSYPEDRVLDASNSAEFNTEKLTLARDGQQEALVAAGGGLCQPLQVMYDIKTVGVTNRPVRDSLVNFNVARGGLQYRQPFDALAMASGLGIWTQTMDRAVDPATPSTLKNCLAVDCPGTVTASIYSTYLCLQFANMTARFDPEWVRATTQSSLVAWARFAENQLLSQILAGSKIIKGKQALGAIRDVLANYDKVISYYRNKHRLSDDIPLRTIAPRWLIDMLRTDIARQFTNGDPGMLFDIAQTQLESFFRTRNVNVTWHLDGLAAPGAPISGITVPAQNYADLAAGATVPPWPTSVDTALFVEGDWLHLDGGTLDLGLVRDSQLNLQNRYQTFIETFEGVAFMGIESLRVVMPLAANGASSGTTAPGVPITATFD